MSLVLILVVLILVGGLGGGYYGYRGPPSYSSTP